MKRWNRILAALLAAMMLCAALAAGAEVELEPNSEQGIEDIELEIAPEEAPDALDDALALPEDLAIDDLDLIDGDIEIPSAEEEQSRMNDEDEDDEDEDDDDYDENDFYIEDDVLVEYLGSGGDVVIPDFVTSIGDNAFWRCDNLTSITIPDSVTSIGDYAFLSCNNLETVNIPASVTSIGEEAFGRCKRLDSIYVDIGNRNYASKDGVLYTRNMKTLITCPGARTSITIPSSVKTIEDWAFDSSQLTKITIPKSVTRIGKDAFYSSSKLSSVTLSKGLERIGEFAFEDCSSLKSIIIPSSVTAIKGGAFYGCKKLTSVTILAQKIKINDYYEDIARYYTFGKCPKSLILYTVNGSQAADWGRAYGLNVVDNLVLLNKNSSKKLEVGNKLRIKMENATAKIYASSNKKIATVSAKGVVTAKAIGTAKISVTLKNGGKRVLTIKATDPAKLSADSVKLSCVDSAKIKLTGGLKRKVTWSTSDAGVVKISKSTDSYATVKGLKKGTVTITAKVAGGKTLKCKVTVVNPVTIRKSSLNDSGKLYLQFTNNSDKKIVYIKFDILQYNNRGDKLQSPYSYYYLNDDLPDHSNDTYYFWVNDDTRSVKFKITEVTFADKTTWKP